MPPLRGEWGLSKATHPLTGRHLRDEPTPPRVERQDFEHGPGDHAYAGAVLLRETVRAVGLIGAVERNLHLKCRDRGLSEAEFVMGTAEAIALGADCLDDLAIARADQAQRTLRGFEIVAPQTAGAWLRRFSLGHIRQLDRALGEVHRHAFTLAKSSTVTLDFDSSYVLSRSKRRQ